MTDGVLRLKGYDFTFRPEPANFIPEPDFIPLTDTNMLWSGTVELYIVLKMKWYNNNDREGHVAMLKGIICNL